MEGSFRRSESGARGVHEFLRSFSIISEQDSDFEDLPDLSADILDSPDGPSTIFQHGDAQITGKIITFYLLIV